MADQGQTPEQISASSASAASVASVSVTSVSSAATASTAAASASSTSASLAAAASASSASASLAAAAPSASVTAARDQTSNPTSTSQSRRDQTQSRSASTQYAANTTSSNSSRRLQGPGSGLEIGQIAGIVVGVAIGAAIIAILATVLIMRQLEKKRQGRQALQTPKKREVIENGSKGREDRSLGQSAGTTPYRVGPLDEYLPQPADDKTIQSKTSTFFDQVQYFVENFCRNRPDVSGRLATSGLSTFDTADLPRPLSSLIPQARDPFPLIKSSLAHFITASITVGAPPETSLLPAEFSMLPAKLAASNKGQSGQKTGLERCLSSWRVLSAYLRPDLSSDTTYQTGRDRKIADSVQRFQQAFAPWLKAEDRDSSQTRTLSIILQEATVLGIILFSQPSDLQFHWPKSTELNPGTIAITPALVKLSNEHGEKLAQGQVLASAETVRL